MSKPSITECYVKAYGCGATSCPPRQREGWLARSRHSRRPAFAWMAFRAPPHDWASASASCCPLIMSSPPQCPAVLLVAALTAGVRSVLLGADWAGIGGDVLRDEPVAFDLRLGWMSRISSCRRVALCRSIHLSMASEIFPWAVMRSSRWWP